jgi:hypothetical protein
MPATNQLVSIYAGDTIVIKINVLDGDGAFVDIGGSTVKWWMGKNAKAIGTDVYIKKNSVDTMVCDDGVTRNQIELVRETDNWQLLVHINSQDTETGWAANPKPGTYYHEAEIIDADGNFSTITIGPFVLNPTLVRKPYDGG